MVCGEISIHTLSKPSKAPITTEQALRRLYVFRRSSGTSRICNVPETFASGEAGRYLAALELLAEYRNSIDMLHFASKWLYANQREEGNWDMGSQKQRLELQEDKQ